MKGFKKHGKFIPTNRKKKSALKKDDIKKTKESEAEIYEERPEWAWLRKR